MEEERLFVAEKIAHRPRVVFVVLANQSRHFAISWRMASDDILPEREAFGFGNALGTFLKYLYSVSSCTGRTNYVNIPITWRWNNFRWKLISRMNADSRNSRNIRPAKYKRFTVCSHFLSCTDHILLRTIHALWATSIKFPFKPCEVNNLQSFWLIISETTISTASEAHDWYCSWLTDCR